MRVLSLFLFCSFSFSQFTDPVINSIEVEKDFITINWTNEKTSSVVVNGFRFLIQYDLEGDFEAPNLIEELPVMYNPDDVTSLLQSYTFGPMAAGAWRVRLCVVELPSQIPVTAWSNIKIGQVSEGLGAPALSVHVQSGVVVTDTVSMSIGEASGGQDVIYDIQHGLDPNFGTFSEDRNIDPQLHIVQLAGVYDAGDYIHFRAVARANGDTRYSTIKTLIYQPDQSINEYIAHVANTPEVITSLYIRNVDSKPVLYELKAKVGGGVFGEAGSPQTVRIYLGPSESWWVDTNDIFPGIHRAPILLSMEGPVITTGHYTTRYGASTNRAMLPAQNQASRSVQIHGIEGREGSAFPGFVVSNITETPGYFTARFIYVSDRLNPAQSTTLTEGFSLPALGSTVALFDEIWPELPTEYMGTLYIESSVFCVAVASVANSHNEFRTIDFLGGN